MAALGIVYGDIGTSPIYAFKECFAPGHGAPVSASNVLGVVSLILWRSESTRLNSSHRL